MEDTTAVLPAEDAVLVERARAGDGGALDALVCRYADTMYRISLGILRDPELAADSTQEACVKVVRGLDRFRGESPVRSWILTITANEARSSLRRRSRRRETRMADGFDPPSLTPDVADAAVAGTEVTRMRRALERLPEKQRLSVSLRVFDGLPFREIAALIGSTEGSARVNYHHGVRKLREELEE